MGKKYHGYLLFFITTSMSQNLKKSEVFNSFFDNQCSLIPNSSILPSELKLLAKHTITSCDFSETDILQIIKNEDSNSYVKAMW